MGRYESQVTRKIQQRYIIKYKIFALFKEPVFDPFNTVKNNAT